MPSFNTPILDKLEQARVFLIETKEDKFIFSENSDYCFDCELSPIEMEQLIKELQMLLYAKLATNWEPTND